MRIPGTLRHRIQIQRPAWSFDEYGRRTETWETIRTTWGAVRPLDGLESVSTDSRRATITHDVWLRYRPEIGPFLFVDGTDFDFYDGTDFEPVESDPIRPDDRLVYDSRTFEITGLREHAEGNRFTVVQAREVVQ